MFVSVDIQQLDAHQAILREELKEADALEELLNRWYSQAAQAPTADLTSVKEMLERVKRQKEYIQNRMRFLETTSDKFLALTHRLDDTLSEARQMLQAQDEH